MQWLQSMSVLQDEIKYMKNIIPFVLNSNSHPRVVRAKIVLFLKYFRTFY